MASWANRCRDLVNAPANELTPERLAAWAEEAAAANPSLRFESLGPEEIRAAGMGAFSAVSQGSDNPPRLITLTYEPDSPADPDFRLGLVGKAITFDAGGLSLKPAYRMDEMKSDMGGGAAALTATAAIAELGLPVRILTVVPSCENMPGGHAFRPGDIVTSMSGKTIEISNTDAEGRLILADALWYARESGATHVIDLATLTGGVVVAMGDLYAGLFGNDDEWVAEIQAAGRGQRRPCLATAAPRALRALQRLRVRRSEELLRLPAGLPHPGRRVSAGVRRRGPVGPPRHRRHVLPRARPRGLLLAARRYRLRRPAPRRARPPAQPRKWTSTSRTSTTFCARPCASSRRSGSRRSPRSSTASTASRTRSSPSSPSSASWASPSPRSTGAAAGDTLSYAIAIEELTRVDSSVAITVAAHTSLGTMPILLFGTDEQKREWLPDLASGRKLAAFGLTEPGAGSDAGATRTHAELRGGSWAVNGSKIFITNAGTDITACVTITARTGEDEISNLIVPNGTPGYEISAPMRKMGWRASDTRELSFRDCEVPEANLLGPRGEGFKQFLEILDGGRISVAAMGLGLAQGAYELARSYAREREQFGKPVAKFQAIQFALADMATEIEAGRGLVYKAAWLKDQDRPFAQEAAMAKLYTGELSKRVADKALQIHGGYGFMDEYAISRLYRDQKVLEIGEGTNEVQRMVIARHLGL